MRRCTSVGTWSQRVPEARDERLSERLGLERIPGVAKTARNAHQYYGDLRRILRGSELEERLDERQKVALIRATMREELRFHPSYAWSLVERQNPAALRTRSLRQLGASPELLSATIGQRRGVSMQDTDGAGTFSGRVAVMFGSQVFGAAVGIINGILLARLAGPGWQGRLLPHRPPAHSRRLVLLQLGPAAGVRVLRGSGPDRRACRPSPSC